jgi:hypothetical protein
MKTAKHSLTLLLTLAARGRLLECTIKTTAFLLAVVVAVAGASGASNLNTKPLKGFYSTKTPYVPEQDPSSYEPAPAGYEPVFTQMVARHGSRALTSSKDIEYVKQLIGYAVADDAFTDLGGELLAQVISLEKANTVVGYGNLTALGIEEHQKLAARLLARLPKLFSSAFLTGRRIMVVNSGKDRAVDSGNTFAASLAAHMPALAPLIDPPVSNTHLLYFFKENAEYQNWLTTDSILKGKLEDIVYSKRSHQEARRLLRRLFSPRFVEKLAAGQFSFKDPKTGNLILNEVDLAFSLYDLYQISPGLRKEGIWDFARFVPEVPQGPAYWFAYLSDAEEFYEKGPSFAGNTITFQMAQVLQDDFFNALEANCSYHGPLAADLRFAHAETVIPFAALMQLPDSDRQVAVSETYSYKNNPWRGSLVSPYAVNIQWDSYANNSGDCLVRMLYDEEQTRFKSACKSIRPGSYFYELDDLERCYGYR